MKKFLSNDVLNTIVAFSFRLIGFLSFFSRRDFIVIFVYAYRLIVVISVRRVGTVIIFFRVALRTEIFAENPAVGGIPAMFVVDMKFSHFPVSSIFVLFLLISFIIRMTVDQ